jgi:nucleoside-diphosphate-sugar epimerase
VTSERILVTGLGGAVGTELSGRLIDLAAEAELVAVFSSGRSRERFLDSVDPALAAVLRAEVCDLTNDRAARSLTEALPTARRTLAVHAAANTSWTLTRRDAIRANVHATRNVAEMVRRSSDTAQMIYVSSAYTAIESWNYRNTYEESKAVAERMLRTDFPDLTPSVFSCSLVVGHSQTGAISRFHGLYPLLRLIDYYELQVVPGGRNRRLDIVPVDWVADELLRLMVEIREGGAPRDVVTSAGEAAPIMPDLVAQVGAALNECRRSEGRDPLPEIAVLGFRQWDFLRRSLDVWDVREVSMPNPRVLDRVLATYRPYLEDDRVLPPSGTATPLPAASGYLDQVVSYWFEQAGRTGRSAIAA